MNLLSFVARPFYMESPTSILIRTAKFNGYRDVWDMCSALGVSHSSSPRDIRLLDQPLCNILCSEAPCLANALRQVFFEHPAQQQLRGCHIKVHNHDVSIRSLRCQFCSCPVCLKSGYTRVAQDFAFFDFCPAHNVRLTSSCPKCGRINKWKKICGFSCECGFNLAEAEIIPYRYRPLIALPSVFAVQDASRLINNFLRDEAQKIKLAEPYPIENTPTSAIYPTIQHAIRMDLNTYHQLPLSAFESIWVTVNDPALRKFALDCLKKNHQGCTPCEKENCCSAIKLTFPQLKHAIGAGAAALRAFINEIPIATSVFPTTNTIGYSHPSLCKVIQAGLDIARKHRFPQYKQDYCSLGTTAILLQTTTTSMVAAIKRGFFPDTIIGDRAYFLPKHTVQKFKDQFAFYSEISDALDISRRTLNRLSNHLGLIHAYKRQPDEPAIYLRSSVDLNRMREKLRQVKLKKRQITPSIEELRKLSKQFNLSVSTLYSILKVYCECSTPSKEISPSQRLILDRWLATHITLKAASKLLKTDAHLLNARFIVSNLVQKVDVCRVRFIAIENLEFMEAHLKKYMSCSQASKLLYLTEGLVIKLAKQGKLKYIILNTSAKKPQVLIEI
ncbi:hypothetical protein [Pseudomonas putida]|uniref:hypothetical protein n=1 Tax=Pseudomonas putida TaxID=303 RepID=UPI0009821E33|nr:hypothetical protein [Pseudomonas putida]OMQ32210.1 hypothetical protein BKX96_24255 [Pseudomonas putida]